MDFLADENVPRQIVERLRADGHTVTSVGETTPAATDDVVLANSNGMGAILITIDKDFGELTFRLGNGSTGIALLRTGRALDERKGRDRFGRRQNAR